MRAKQTLDTLAEAQIEQVLRNAAADSALLSEPPADMVQRSLRNAPKRQGAVRVMPRVVGAVVGVVGVLIVTFGDLTPLPPLPDARTSLGEGESETLPLVSLPTSILATPDPNASFTRLPLSQRGTSVRERGKGGEVSESHLHRHHHTHHRQSAVPTQVAERPTRKRIPQAAARPRPFWHDEQVERDDYTVSAPALLAEGTGNDVTSIQPALVQVSFSTTHPVADAGDTSSGN